jgi:uncharacterized membrane protein
MAHLIVGWVAVAIGAFILFGSMMTRRGKREAMTALPIGLFALVIGLWQLGVLPLGQFLTDVTGIGKR